MTKPLLEGACALLATRIEVAEVGLRVFRPPAGTTARKNYNEKTFTPTESLDYFLDYFEKWRAALAPHFAVETKEFTDFFLAGH